MIVKNNKFWQLLKPVHPQAEAFCRKLMANREDGDDLYQDGLLQALENIDSLKDENAFRSWLYRILVNTYRNRRRRHRLIRFVRLDFHNENSFLSEDPNDRYTLSRQLAGALSVLSEENRALILMFELEGFTIDELTQILSKPSGTIKARLSRSRQKMRRFLEKKLNRNKNTETDDEVRYALQRSKTMDK